MAFGTWSWIFIITAAVVLIIKNLLITNIDANFSMSNDVKATVSSYKRMFKFVKYKLSNTNKPSMNLKEWLEEEKEIEQGEV